MSEQPDLPALLGAVAHDLRTPLAVIYGFAATLERMGGLDERQSRFLGLIREGADDMDRQIGLVATIGRVCSGRVLPQPAAVSTADLVAAALESVPDRADGRVVRALDGEPATVSVDPTFAAQALGLLAEATLRLDPARQQAEITAEGAAVAILAFAPELVPVVARPGRDVPIETARILLVWLGATIAVDTDGTCRVSFRAA